MLLLSTTIVSQCPYVHHAVDCEVDNAVDHAVDHAIDTHHTVRLHQPDCTNQLEIASINNMILGSGFDGGV